MASFNTILSLSLALLATVLLLSSQLTQAREDIPCSNVWSEAKCRELSHNGNDFLCLSKLERGKHLRAACKKTCHMCEPSEVDLEFPNHPYKPSEQSPFDEDSVTFEN
ncbi:hypothetical protein QR680_018088 [Steinernema hermaphroditum]|uniref:ShKT domain-containing protein n=1 Tax=Steinernema hermaphroditum TaxID=289476 RepID=A0AA39LPU2_9BILA|nr:hypothetical protein QR680_018088 [Steinernema hermaphroditum]